MWWSVYHDPARPDAFDQATSHLFSGLEQDPEATSGKPAFALDFNARLGELRSAGFLETDRRVFTKMIDFTPDRLAALYILTRPHGAAGHARAPALRNEADCRGGIGGSVKREIAVSAFIGRRSL